jgi:glycerophosphoryl diester phosphodiesterase
VAAHRGARLDAPENTLAAVQLAIAQGADMIEIDVQRTRDGTVVLLHDPILDRTTNGTGPLHTLTLDIVRQLDAGAWFAPQFAGTRVPTLREVLAVLPPDVAINIELKHYWPDHGLAAAVLHDVHALNMEARTLISSSSVEMLHQVRQLDDRIVTGLITMRVGTNPASLARRAGVDVLHPNWRFLSRIACRRAHEQQVPLAVWTVNSPLVMRSMIARGIAILITDRPQLARSVCYRSSSSSRPA